MISNIYNGFPIGTPPAYDEKYNEGISSEQDSQHKAPPEINQGRRYLMKAAAAASYISVRGISGINPIQQGDTISSSESSISLLNPPEYLSSWFEGSVEQGIDFNREDISKQARQRFTQGVGLPVDNTGPEGPGYGIEGTPITRKFMETILNLGILHNSGEGNFRLSDIYPSLEDFYRRMIVIASLNQACVEDVVKTYGINSLDFHLNDNKDKIEGLTDDGKIHLMNFVLAGASDFRSMYFAIATGSVQLADLEPTTRSNFFLALDSIFRKMDATMMINRDIPESKKWEDMFNNDHINGIIGGVSGKASASFEEGGNGTSFFARQGIKLDTWKNEIKKIIRNRELKNSPTGLPNSGR